MLPGRVMRVAGGSVLLLLALIGRLYELQVVNGRELAEAGLAQRLRGVAVAAERGYIYDRHGLPLAAPELSIDLVLFPGSAADPDAAADRLVRAMGVEREAVLNAFAAPDPVVLKAGLTSLHVDRAQALVQDIPGLRIVVRQQRTGRQALARHVLGTAQAGDGSGSGLEAGLERFLAGQTEPVVAAFVDGNNRLIPGLGYRYLDASDGHGLDAYLTISAPWQAAAEEALQVSGRPGAAVVVDSETGDIVALASAPAPPQSYLNRAVLAYPPGSLFSLVVLAAAVADGVAHIDDEWNGSGMTVRDAFVQSHPDLFMELGTAVGAERLLATAARLGLGERHDIGLAAEEAGAVPELAAISAGDLRLLSVGQGPLTVTPLQVASLLASIRHGGIQPPLRLVQEVRNRDGLVVWRPPAASPRPALSAPVAQQLRDVLRTALASHDGMLPAVPGLWAGGQSGTAEAFHPATGEPLLHAWFAGLVDLPQAYGARRLAIVVLCEDAGDSGDAAIDVFSDLLRRVLELAPKTE